MLQRIIQRRLRPAFDTASPAEEPDAPVGGEIRPTDWLLGGSVVTLAVVFVAGLLGLRSSTADLQVQSRNNTHDLAALKADTLNRINGIAGDLAKTNQTLTDLIALRTSEPKGTAGKAGDGTPANGKPAAGRPMTRPLAAGNASPAVAPRPVTRPGSTRLAPVIVRRRPERAREQAGRHPEPPRTLVRATLRDSAELVRERQGAILRQLRMKRLARRGTGPQPL